uniref:Dynein axonemal intermediate chain 7 n=1 Tax=Oryzias latipes TaxID=8090 RepID=A0A3B3H620_ORYLA
RARQQQEEEERKLREEDLTERRHVNTYISLWRDDPEVNISQVLQQCSCLEVLLEEVSDPEEAEKLQESFVNLQEIIHLKLNLAAEEILKAANKNIDPETENMQTVITDDNVTLCLWANLRKRMRFKGFHFEKAGLSFELPKSLAVKDVAIGILHTRYDHLSVLARMTHKATHESVWILSSPMRSKGLGGVASSVLEKKEILKVESDETQSTPGSEDGKVRCGRGFLSVLHHHLTESRLTEMGSDEVVDLLKYSPLGGVFYYGVFHLPPQAHLIVDSGLKAFPYTMTPSEKDKDFTSIYAGTRWVGGVMDLTYQETEAKVSFRMPSFRPFVLMQETYANLPFQSWELRALSDNSALFSISVLCCRAPQENLCMLQSDQRKGLAHILGRWMSRAALQRAMTKAGLHIFVNEHTDRYVHTCRKVTNPTTEHAAYQQMALLASACAFSWSKWNTQCGDEHLVMQVCEHLPPTAVPAGRWSLYLLGAQRVQRLEATENSETFSLDHHPDSEFHSTLVHMLRDTMSPDGAARTRESGYRFVEAVQSLLCSTRPLRFSS